MDTAVHGDFCSCVECESMAWNNEGSPPTCLDDGIASAKCAGRLRPDVPRWHAQTEDGRTLIFYGDIVHAKAVAETFQCRMDTFTSSGYYSYFNNSIHGAKDGPLTLIENRRVF